MLEVQSTQSGETVQVKPTCYLQVNLKTLRLSPDDQNPLYNLYWRTGNQLRKGKILEAEQMNIDYAVTHLSPISFQFSEEEQN